MEPVGLDIGGFVKDSAQIWIALDVPGRAIGGQGGIRTHGELAPTAVFKTAALNHSATCPYQWNAR